MMPDCLKASPVTLISLFCLLLLGLSPPPSWSARETRADLATGSAPERAAVRTESRMDLTPDEAEWLKAHPVIRVGGETNWAPYEFVDDLGRYQGVVRDYLDELERLLGVRFEVTSSAVWADLMAGIRAGDIDLLPALYKTDEREQFLTFTRPYTRTNDFIFTRFDNTEITDIDSLRGTRVAIVRDYAIQDVLQNPALGIHIVVVDSQHTALKAVISGEADAYVGDVNSVSYLIQTEGFGGLKLAGSSGLEKNGVHMAVRAELAPLAGLIDKAMA